MKQSNFLSLNWRDVLRGFLLALIAFVLNWLQESFIPALDVSPEVKTMILAGLAYLAKNFFTIYLKKFLKETQILKILNL